MARRAKTLEDVAEEVASGDSKDKKANNQAWRRKEVGGDSIDKADVERRVRERVEEYEKDFDLTALTGIDRRNIRNLAALEVRADIINEATLDPSGFTPHELDKLSASLERIMKEARLQAEALGMSRAQRLEEGADDDTFLPKLYKEVKEILYKQSLIILCPHCIAEPQRTEIRQGLILDFPSMVYHFAFEMDNWSFKAPCPRCKKQFEINAKNYRDFLFSKVDTYTTKDDETARPNTDEGDVTPEVDADEG